ncbi:S8 family serine peptidase [Calditrichota bacterium]
MRLQLPRIITLALLLLVILTAPVLSNDLDDLSWGEPGENVAEGIVTIIVTHDVFPLKLKTIDSRAYTGVSSIDMVADAYSFTKIRKTFRMPEPPSKGKVDLSRFYTVWFSELIHPRDVIEELLACPEVELAEYVPLNRDLFTPDDAQYGSQWHLTKCNLPDAWETTKGSPDIIIGIVDDGMDMEIDEYGDIHIHPDILPNIWVNPGEDLDGDGEISWEEWNNRDDDNNGFIDDFHGWDFPSDDNWPDDYWADSGQGGHGTHVAGCASAATNNEIGVAAPGFSAKIMVSAQYNPRDPDTQILGHMGIEYCALNGADIINLSYGLLGRGFQAEKSAIEYALEEGSIIFAGAGNDDVEDDEDNNTHFYPCAYDGVIGVGASDRSDDKADFSTYGSYTDVITPGVGIRSTYPRLSYASLQGTSMSSPFAAGIGALLLSIRPNLTNEEMLEMMQATAVDISEQNADYPGIKYRLDAGYLINSLVPQYDLLEWAFEEISGDGDKRLEPGEEFAISFKLENMESYNDATNATVTFVSDDSTLIPINEVVEIGDIASGETVSLEAAQSVSFRISEDAEVHYSGCSIQIYSDEEYTKVFDFSTIIGHTDYLVIDDDGGEIFERYYSDDLDTLGYVHEMWSVEEDGEIPSADLNTYRFVFWETGKNETPLSENEMRLITSYLHQGRTLFISGQYIGDQVGNTEFHEKVLHAEHLSDDTGARQLLAVADHPLVGGTALFLQGSGGASNTSSPSSMKPLEGAEALYNYGSDGTGEPGAIYYRDEFRYALAYFGFPFEAVSGLIGSTLRIDVFQIILEDIQKLDVSDPIDAQLPNQFEITALYPNPFNPELSIGISVPLQSNFTVSVFDINGRLVETLHNGRTQPGQHTLEWDAQNSSAGVYFVNLQWEQGNQVAKAILMK